MMAPSPTYSSSGSTISSLCSWQERLEGKSRQLKLLIIPKANRGCKNSVEIPSSCLLSFKSYLTVEVDAQPGLAG
ncbi:hypothetical protein EsDP_00004453 [Epichloe bromicola]|uniref:Uncharacterized protein n=1 Tax=Epichloe bromicola TaxID=79588 RepID=A0ABQ0CRT1_9HYPO